MKHIKDINNYNLLTESLVIYDFGVKISNLLGYYDESCYLAKPFPKEDEGKVRGELTKYKIILLNFSERCLVLESDKTWKIHYYGDFCYGIFGWDTASFLDKELIYVEICDGIEHVIDYFKKEENKQ